MAHSKLTPDSPAHLSELEPSFALHLRAGNKSARTVQSYLESLERLIQFLEREGLPCTANRIEQSHIQAFTEDQLARNADSTAALRFRSLQQFFRWAVMAGELTKSPMDGLKPPSVGKKPVPIIDDHNLRLLLKACSGKTFEDLRDTAMIRFAIDTGCRLSEMMNLQVASLVTSTSMARVMGKGSKIRDVPFGPKAHQAFDKYLKLRRRHSSAETPWLWLAMRGRMTTSGASQMLDKRCKQAGIPHLHWHQFRHTAAHVWLMAGGNEGDLMQIAGWSSRDMLSRYGASAANHRAQEAFHRLNPGDRV